MWTVPSSVSDVLFRHDVWVVSVSGGPDSMLLLEWCWAKKEVRQTIVVRTGHHGQRDDAHHDVELVQKWCKSHDVRCEVGYYDGIHTESAMREWRKEELVTLAIEMGGCVLTGHHLDDRIETVLYRLWKGTGILGMGAIPPVQFGDVYRVRPMVDMTKEDIIALCAQRDIPYRIDSTNMTEEGGARNRMRNVMVPLAQEKRKKGKREKKYTKQWYTIRRQWFQQVDRWRERLQGSYEIVSLPRSPFWSEEVECGGVSKLERVKRTPSLIALVLMEMGVYRHQNVSGMEVLMRFFAGEEGCRLDYGEVVLWNVRGKIIVMEGRLKKVEEGGRRLKEYDGFRLAQQGDKVGSQSLTRVLQKSGVPSFWRSSALVREEGGQIMEWTMPTEYERWRKFFG